MQEIKYPIIEIISTIQGEGKFAGTPAIFIRLAGCQIGCEWCDTKNSWDASLYPSLSSIEITQKCEQLLTLSKNSSVHPSIIVITGGEPAAYNLTSLTENLSQLKIPIHLETSGAYPIRGNFSWITISPKPHLTNYSITSKLKSNLQIASELKVIIFKPLEDLEWAEKCKQFVSPNAFLCLQPEWYSLHKVFPYVLEYVIKHPEWHISFQFHKLFQLP